MATRTSIIAAWMVVFASSGLAIAQPSTVSTPATTPSTVVQPATPMRPERPQIDRVVALRFDPQSKLFSIHAAGVARGQLLDQLARISGIEVRPQPARDEPVTLDADALTLQQLLARVMPAGTPYVTRRGVGDAANVAANAGLPKRGEPLPADPKLTAKPSVRLSMKSTKPTDVAGAKLPPERLLTEPAVRTGSGPSFKEPAEKLISVAQNEPKRPMITKLPRNAIRITLTFAAGQAPKLAHVQLLEGNPVIETFVRGPYLFAALGASGEVLQFGSFPDPLEQHSYLQSGPHDIAQAKTGVAAFYLARDKLAAARLVVVDGRGLPLPRELNERVFRSVMERARPVLQVEAATLLRFEQ